MSEGELADWGSYPKLLGLGSSAKAYAQRLAPRGCIFFRDAYDAKLRAKPALIVSWQEQRIRVCVRLCAAIETLRVPDGSMVEVA